METKIYKTEKELVQFMHKFNGETSREVARYMTNKNIYFLFSKHFA